MQNGFLFVFVVFQVGHKLPCQIIAKNPRFVAFYSSPISTNAR